MATWLSSLFCFLLIILSVSSAIQETDSVQPVELGGVGAKGTKIWCANERLRQQEELGLLKAELKAAKIKMAAERSARVKAEGQMGVLKAQLRSVEESQRGGCAGELAKAQAELRASQDNAAKAANVAEKQTKWYKKRVKEGDVMKERMRTHLTKYAKSNKDTMALAGAVLYGVSTQKSTRLAKDAINKFMKRLTKAGVQARGLPSKVNAEHLAAMTAVNQLLKEKLKKAQSGEATVAVSKKGAKKKTKVIAKKGSAKKGSAKKAPAAKKPAAKTAAAKKPK